MKTASQKVSYRKDTISISLRTKFLQRNTPATTQNAEKHSSTQANSSITRRHIQRATKHSFASMKDAARASSLRRDSMSIWRSISTKENTSAKFKAVALPIVRFKDLMFTWRSTTGFVTLHAHMRDAVRHSTRKAISRLTWDFILEKSPTTALSKDAISPSQIKVTWISTKQSTKIKLHLIIHQSAILRFLAQSSPLKYE